jgi:hypothetical protein
VRIASIVAAVGTAARVAQSDRTIGAAKR